MLLADRTEPSSATMWASVQASAGETDNNSDRAETRPSFLQDRHFNRFTPLPFFG
jgi:hypothetical protein